MQIVLPELAVHSGFEELPPLVYVDDVHYFTYVSRSISGTHVFTFLLYEVDQWNQLKQGESDKQEYYIIEGMNKFRPLMYVNI